MPTPEQERPASVEQQPTQPSFEERIKDLINPKTNERGDVLQKPPIKDEGLQRLGRMALDPRNQTAERLGELLKKGDDWYLDEKVPEDEWSIMAAELNAERERLLQKEQEQGREERAVGAHGVSEQQGWEELIEAFRRLPSEREMMRWTEVELRQDFYSRFTPNMEPRFYTEASQEEREDWDARWQLARAAFYKRMYSAFPEKQTENQDLIQLTTEQMERLYHLPGVKEALEWYANQIVNGDYVIYFDDETGRRLTNAEVQGLSKEDKEKKGKRLLDCVSGYQFEEFRKDLREKILAGRKKWYEGKGTKRRGEERELSDLERMSADAVAWNLIWVGNLVESLDSRYSQVGELELRDRHGDLAPELCSDDLRAVFHPLEKFEDKSRKGQEWGAFGKWGVYQIERIKKEHRAGSNDIQYEPARRVKDYWSARRDVATGKIIVSVPECYPTITMKSFFETYKVKDNKGNEDTLLGHFLNERDINWYTLQANPWQTNYLTIRLPKAVALLSFFKGRADKKGWTNDLLDIFTRLGMEDLLREYYERAEKAEAEKAEAEKAEAEKAEAEKAEKEEAKIRKKAERLAKRHFHNLKVWAYFAPFGGVGRPQDRQPRDPFSPARIRGLGAMMNLSDREYILRRPQSRYLGRRERLKIEDIN